MFTDVAVSAPRVLAYLLLVQSFLLHVKHPPHSHDPCQVRQTHVEHQRGAKVPIRNRQHYQLVGKQCDQVQQEPVTGFQVMEGDIVHVPHSVPLAIIIGQVELEVDLYCMKYTTGFSVSSGGREATSSFAYWLEFQVRCPKNHDENLHMCALFWWGY